MQTDSIPQLISSIANFDSLNTDELPKLTRDLKQLVSHQPELVEELFQRICDLEPQQLASASSLLSTLVLMISGGAKAKRPSGEATQSPRGFPLPATVQKLFLLMQPQSPLRFQLLRLLAQMLTDESLNVFGELINMDPPQTEADVLSGFEPLFSTTHYRSTNLFPKMFDLIAHPKAASAVIDLANYVFRNSITPTHPAADRLPMMRGLLKQLCQRLEIVEENPLKQSQDPAQIAATVTDSAALIVALCDLLALAGDGGEDDQQSIDVLKKANSLAHRRIRAEASAALFKLGDGSGKQSLLELAGDASVRLRVLKYAEELQLLDEIQPEFQSDQAIAESRLTMWLAQPRQMGVPPTSCHLIDHRTQYWPGYDEPVECRLFRFVYALGGAEHENVGITGPMTHAFLGSLIDLPISDIYAGFAGWQAEHEEILEYDVADLNPHHQTDVERLKRRLHDAGYETIDPQIFGRFFGQPVLVAPAIHEGRAGIAVVDAEEELWLPETEKQNRLSAEEAWCVYKGRRLLHAFN